MPGLGTIINVVAVMLGGFAGLLFGRVMAKRYQDTLMQANAVCVMFIGIAGAMQQILKISDGTLTSSGTMMMIGSYALGALTGEWINLELRMEQFGEWLKVKTRNERDMAFVDAFVSTSLTVCIGAMAVVGAIQDGINGDYTILAAKAVLDLIIVMVMTASMGKGCIFSAIPIALFQGSITVLARLIQPVMTQQALSNLSLTGSILIFCVGVNLLWGKRIRVANLLPTIVFAVLWAFLPA
ncbi:MAG: DUF554 domain-containing protein [Clostridiales bacterium]|nr:DUF554 domain-containing protein [Clostridiales bacterium]